MTADEKLEAVLRIVAGQARCVLIFAGTAFDAYLEDFHAGNVACVMRQWGDRADRVKMTLTLGQIDDIAEMGLAPAEADPVEDSLVQLAAELKGRALRSAGRPLAEILVELKGD